MEKNTLILYQNCSNACARHLRRAMAFARNWDWDKVEHELDEAYRLVGAENPGTGYDFHIGRHPIQVDDLIGVLAGMDHGD